MSLFSFIIGFVAFAIVLVFLLMVILFVISWSAKQRNAGPAGSNRSGGSVGRYGKVTAKIKNNIATIEKITKGTGQDIDRKSRGFLGISGIFCFPIYFTGVNFFS